MGRLGTVQSVSYTGTAGTISSGISGSVQRIRVLVTTDAFIKIAGSPTATTSDVYLPGLQPEYFTVNPGEKVSAIQVASGGSLYVTEIV
jgi:hypothetical protein